MNPGRCCVKVGPKLASWVKSPTPGSYESLFGTHGIQIWHRSGSLEHQPKNYKESNLLYIPSAGSWPIHITFVSTST